MFTKVHHVIYVVHSIRQMEDYLERNFGMVPERTDDFPDRGYSSIMYRVGTTLVDFFEPTGEDTAIGRRLKEGGRAWPTWRGRSGALTRSSRT